MHSTTRHHFHSLIRAALNQSIRWRWLALPNPATEAQAPALAPDERVPPTTEEARQLALAVSYGNPDLAALIFVDASTGMRRGEICGLRFCDIDFHACAATIWWRCFDLPKDETAAVAGRTSVVKAFPCQALATGQTAGDRFMFCRRINRAFIRAAAILVHSSLFRYQRSVLAFIGR